MSETIHSLNYFNMLFSFIFSKYIYVASYIYPDTVYSVHTVSPSVQASNRILCDLCHEPVNRGKSSSSNTLIQYQENVA
jgi:hypothetical protein